MAFASPRSSSRAGNGAHRATTTPRTTDTQAPSGTYLWPSETDPDRAHWLRNEVIAFERSLVQLRQERENVVEVLHRDEAGRERAEAAQAAVQARVDDLDARLAELLETNAEQKERISVLQEEVDATEATKEALSATNSELSKRQSFLDSEAVKAKESVTLQKSVVVNLQKRCVELQAQLEDLRTNPTIPKEYQAHVSAVEDENKNKIASLQQELEGLLGEEEEQSLKAVEKKEELLALQQEREEAEVVTEEARVRAEAENQARVESELELEELQHKYYLSPDVILTEEKVTEQEIEVQREIVFEQEEEFSLSRTPSWMKE